jgi:hypothetical protein
MSIASREDETPTCVDPECLNSARRGEWCDECQRAKALCERRSVNVQRGF